MSFDWSSFNGLVMFIYAFGVAATMMVRLHHGTDEEHSYHGLFFVSLILVALAAIAEFAIHSACFFSGVVLALMVLGVTCDFSSHTTRAADSFSRSRRSG